MRLTLFISLCPVLAQTGFEQHKLILLQHMQHEKLPVSLQEMAKKMKQGNNTAEGNDN